MKKNIRANAFNTGIASEYFILSQLYRQGIEAYISQGNKKAIDIRIIKGDGSPVSVDVKSVRDYSSFVVNNVESKEDHFICFVRYKGRFSDVDKFPEVYIVPSVEVIKNRKEFKKEKRMMIGSILEYRDRWDLLK
jgi:hypothetical protein